MNFSEFSHVKLSAISVVVPKNEINIYDEAQYYGNDVRKIDRMRKMVGFWKRRVAPDDITPSDLAIGAAQKLFTECNVDKNSIDELVFVHQKLNYLGPIDAYEIHHKLGLPDRCICTSVLQGCAGWVWGIYLASQLVQSGTVKRVLLLTGDTHSVGCDLSDRNTAPIFGDAGSATLVEYSDIERKSFFGIKTVSSGFDKIICPAGGCRLRYDFDLSPEDPFNKPLLETITSKAGYKTRLLRAQMDGGAVFEFTMNEVPSQIKEVLNFSNLTSDDISKCCLHQANKQIVQTVAMAADFDLEKTPYGAFEKYGNNTMNSVPTVLSDLYSSNNNSFESKPYLCSGFGNGLVIATAVLDLHDTVSTGVCDFEKPAGFKNRDEWVAFWKAKVTGEA